jgi:hypothetical protein
VGDRSPYAKREKHSESDGRRRTIGGRPDASPGQYQNG